MQLSAETVERHTAGMAHCNATDHDRFPTAFIVATFAERKFQRRIVIVPTAVIGSVLGLVVIKTVSFVIHTIRFRHLNGDVFDALAISRGRDIGKAGNGADVSVALNAPALRQFDVDVLNPVFVIGKASNHRLTYAQNAGCFGSEFPVEDVDPELLQQTILILCRIKQTGEISPGAVDQDVAGDVFVMSERILATPVCET